MEQETEKKEEPKTQEQPKDLAIYKMEVIGADEKVPN